MRYARVLRLYQSLLKHKWPKLMAFIVWYLRGREVSGVVTRLLSHKKIRLFPWGRESSRGSFGSKFNPCGYQDDLDLTLTLCVDCMSLMSSHFLSLKRKTLLWFTDIRTGGATRGDSQGQEIGVIIWWFGALYYTQKGQLSGYLYIARMSTVLW